MMRVGHGFDAHRLVEGRPLILGGVRVPFERGPLGHSDGDALAHAVADALLGAAGLPDLGSRFPASDARWKDADSLDLLARCAAASSKRCARSSPPRWAWKSAASASKPSEAKEWAIPATAPASPRMPWH